MAQGKKNIKQKQTRGKSPVQQAGKNMPLSASSGGSSSGKLNSTQRFTSNKYFVPAILVLSCLLLYGNTLFNEYACDDGIYTYQNELIKKGFSAFKDIFDKGSLYGWSKSIYVQQYRPLTLLNFMIEVSIFGLKPHVSHFFNILFFIITVVLLYFFLKKILKNYNEAIPVAATLLFAFHPIHTEVVANIKSRDEILSLLFGLSSFYYLMRYHEKSNKKIFYYISLAAFFVAIFCKESALTFIVIIPLLLFFFTELKMKEIALKSVPYFVLVGIYFFIRSRVLLSMTYTTPLGIMDNGLMVTNNSLDRMATSFVLMGKYIFMNFVPYPLSWDYSYNQIPIVSWGNIKAIMSLLVCLALVIFMFWGLQKKSIYSFLIALFFITLFLSSNLLVKIASTFGERFLYVPSLSFCIALPILTARLVRLNPAQSAWKNSTYFYIPILCLLIVYTAIVIPRNAQWKNDAALFYSGAIVSPNSGRTHMKLAEIYLDSAATIKDSVAKAKVYLKGFNEYKKATKIWTMNSNCFYNLGACYIHQGYKDSAIPDFKRALKLNPQYSDAANNLGLIYFEKHQYDTGISYLLKAFKFDSNNLTSAMNIAVFYQNQKNYAQALHFDSIILKRDTDRRSALLRLVSLHIDIGVDYNNNNELDKALKEFSAALSIDSNSAYALDNIGVVYAKAGNVGKAKGYYLRALAKAPGNEAFKRNLQLLEGGKLD